ncbi:Protein FAM210A [Apodemus speciosus]|uniref:Protein FAM210A n=1 Tax=Apodemus speciosus TaxID=105296 RepID=A0ABQ0FRS6_APOSI
MSRLALRTLLEAQKARLFDHHWSIKGPLLVHRGECRVVWIPRLRKQWLHLSAVQCLAKQRNLLDAQPPQPGALRQERWVQDILFKRDLSSSSKSQETPSENKEEPDPLQDKSISLYQRFKKTFRQYGKVLIPVHLITSGIWFGTFYYATIKGVNVIPFLEVIGLPDSIVDILKNSQSGNALTAYAMFKQNIDGLTVARERSAPDPVVCAIATPARYTVTLGGTSFTVKYLRSHGYMSTPPPVKEYLQGRMEETKELITEKMEETKDRLTEKLQETKEKVSFKKKVE